MSENSFQDEGIIYISIALKSCLSIVYLVIIKSQFFSVVKLVSI
jgi:hypothetical protein